MDVILSSYTPKHGSQPLGHAPFGVVLDICVSVIYIRNHISSKITIRK